MVVNDCKTKKKYGCNRVNISSYDYVNQHLGKYVREEREKLMFSKRHDFLLTKGSRQPFDTSETFTIHIEKAFQRHNGGLKFTTTALRKALVNWLVCNKIEDESFLSKVVSIITCLCLFSILIYTFGLLPVRFFIKVN